MKLVGSGLPCTLETHRWLFPPSECSLEMFSVQSMCRHGVLFMRTEAVTACIGEAGSDPEPTVA